MKYIGEHIYIRLLELSDAQAKLDLNIRNREFFQNYSPQKTEEYYTFEEHTKIIEKCIEESKKDTRYSFGIFLWKQMSL